MPKGMTVSQAGIGVDDASDAQKVIDTRWKYMDVMIEKKIIFPAFTQPQAVVIFQHDLDFLPAFDIYLPSSDVYIAPFSAGGAPTVDGSGYIFIGGIYATKKTIQVSGFFQDDYNLAGKTVILRIYNVAIAEEYTAPFAVTLNKEVSRPSNYGMKILGRTSRNTLRSAELTDYGLNTEAKALAIQKTGIVIGDTSTAFKAVVTHGLGAPPSYLAAFYFKPSDIVGALAPDFMPVLAVSNAATLTFSGAQSALVTRIAYIILKDPADLAL